MKRKDELTDVVPMIRFASLLWIGYIVVLAAINMALGPPTMPDERIYNVLYYILNAVVALLCLNLTYWTWIQKALKQAFIPLIIVIITVLPIIINWMMTGLFPLGSRFAPDSPSMRLIPFLFIGLLLVSWRYRWQYIILVILGVTGPSYGLMWASTGMGITSVRGDLASMLIQVVIFLAMGFSISYLMNGIRKQQRSLEEANVRLTHYASTLEQLTASRERNRLARELHDTLAHTLSGLSVQMETIKAYWDVDPKTARELFDQSLAAAHTGLAETRRALQALRASPLDDMGLVLAMTTMVKDVAQRANLTLDLKMPDKIPALSPDVEQCIYRITQEAVTNVGNHAGAKNLLVKLETIEDGRLVLTVRDDGAGFDVSGSAAANRFGLQGMRERAELIGGHLSIISKPEHGTTVQLSVEREKEI